MQVTELRSIPLFASIREDRLRELMTAFKRLDRIEGTTLFRAGDLPTHFEILTKGIVVIDEDSAPRNGERRENRASRASVRDLSREGAEEMVPSSRGNGLRPASKFYLHAIAPIGELGAITGMRRNTTATAATDVELLSIPIGDLLGLFDKNADIAFPFYKELLGVVSDKVRHDRRRLGEMRSNIIRTQKAMKTLRELVLSSRETEISKPIFECLDDLIQNNRRANYRVTPVAMYPARVRLDDGRIISVIEVSQGYLKLKATSADELTRDHSFWAGVLVLPAGEVLVSGRVLREGPDGVVIKLDTMIDEYRERLDDYTTKLQLFDFVV